MNFTDPWGLSRITRCRVVRERVEKNKYITVHKCEKSGWQSFNPVGGFGQFDEFMRRNFGSDAARVEGEWGELTEEVKDEVCGAIDALRNATEMSELANLVGNQPLHVVGTAGAEAAWGGQGTGQGLELGWTCKLEKLADFSLVGGLLVLRVRLVQCLVFPLVVRAEFLLTAILVLLLVSFQFQYQYMELTGLTLVLGLDIAQRLFRFQQRSVLLEF